jgi:hypothetical protein
LASLRLIAGNGVGSLVAKIVQGFEGAERYAQSLGSLLLTVLTLLVKIGP